MGGFCKSWANFDHGCGLTWLHPPQARPHNRVRRGKDVAVAIVALTAGSLKAAGFQGAGDCVAMIQLSALIRPVRSAMRKSI